MQFPRSLSIPVTTIGLLSACAGSPDTNTSDYLEVGRPADSTEIQTLQNACYHGLKGFGQAVDWMDGNIETLEEYAGNSSNLSGNGGQVPLSVVIAANKQLPDFCDNMVFEGPGVNVAVFDDEHPIDGCGSDAKFCYVEPTYNVDGEIITYYSEGTLSDAKNALNTYILGQSQLAVEDQTMDYIEESYMAFWGASYCDRLPEGEVCEYDFEDDLSSRSADLIVRGNISRWGYKYSDEYKAAAEDCANGDIQGCVDMANEPIQMAVDHLAMANQYAHQQPEKFDAMLADCEINPDTCLLNSEGFAGYNWDITELYPQMRAWYNADTYQYTRD